MSDYEVCGVLVHSRTENIPTVETKLQSIDGVEVHATTDDGRLIVTVESANGDLPPDTMARFHDIKGVLSAALIYQYADPVSTTGQELSQ